MTPDLITNDLVNWLLAGDVAIQYQVYRDLLDEERPDLRARQPEGHWGRGFYQPKWISTHYTLLNLKHLGIPPDNAPICESILHILTTRKEADGGVNPAKTVRDSDVCVNGMFLNYACYFRTPAEPLQSIVDFLIGVQMADGGFNCQSNQQGAVHSSLHSTISVLEGIAEYLTNGYAYRAAELSAIAGQAQEFILQHRLFRSDHTGETINLRFLLLSYPSRWYYDILRALDNFRSTGAAYDPRLQDALRGYGK